MKFTDTHTHLYLGEFATDIGDVIERSLAAGVSRLILPNIDSSSAEPMMKVCNNYKGICCPAIGLHPGSVNAGFEKELENVDAWLNKEKFVAIGEIGIDLYWDKTFFKEQVIAFKYQLKRARECNLPVIIHSRNALNEIINILNEKDFADIKAVFHCFPGSYEQALYLTGKGYKLGIGGVVTYKNAGLARIARELPLEHFLLETDSPYLPPVPFRGKRNESAYIFTIAQFIAAIRDCPVEEVAEITSANADKFFAI